MIASHIFFINLEALNVLESRGAVVKIIPAFRHESITDAAFAYIDNPIPDHLLSRLGQF